MDSITQIFIQKNVGEVRELEKKTRQEIEKKKEDLRQMVGERYRDLIEAADTISEMKSCSENVKDSVKHLQQFCSKKSGKHQGGTKKQQKIKNVKKYMEIAAEAKILMEMPEKIWNQVESGHMMKASFLYLQSLRVLKNLSLDGTTSYSPVLLWFPMLGQQAQAVRNIRTAILKKCHSNISDFLLHTDNLADALCSIVLLEEVSITDVFQILLKSRANAVKDIVGGGVTGSRSMAAKARICDSVNVLVQTVFQLHNLFCADGGGLVGKILQGCSSEDVVAKFLDQVESSNLWIKHLPQDIISDLINLDTTSFVIPSEVIQSCSLAWLTKCETDIRDCMEELLCYTSTGKDLANIRSALLEVLKDTRNEQEVPEPDEKWSYQDVETPKKDNSWVNICSQIFNRKLDIWTELLRDIFVEKVNHLVKRTMDELFSKTKNILEKFLEADVDMENVCSFLWREHDDDISSSTAWTPWQNRTENSPEMLGGLSLKAKTVTPSVQNVCRQINETLLDLLTDLNHYASSLSKQNTKNKPYELRFSTDKNPKPTCSEIEHKTIINHLKVASFDFIHTLVGYIKDTREQIKDKMSKDPSSNQMDADQAWALSLICQNFFALCYAFKKCCSLKESSDETHSLRRQLSSTSSTKAKLDSLKDEDNIKWDQVVAEMFQQSQKLMLLWCDTVLQKALKDYRKELLSSAMNGNILQSIALWDSITVEEESESGETIKSLIKIPANTTSHMQRLLCSLTSEVNRVGGYSAGRYILQSLSQGCLNGIYEAFSETHRVLSTADTSLHGQSRVTGDSCAPTQAWALQCLFDLRYAHNLLYRPPSLSLHEDKSPEDENDEDGSVSAAYTFTELVDWLEGFVDPFDLDVFSPHLTRNIQRHVTRTCVLLGLLTVPEKIASSSAQKFSSATKDSHNVMPMAADCGRFSYLPMSGRNVNARSGQRLTSSITRQLPLANALRDLTHTVNENEKESQQNRLTSSLYSKLGALSSSWLSMSSSYSE
ncbi:conserved oligomeric Golgi complex subunit 1-like [Clavelina lepadiformis]|uniref:Conserved oligomeric Golgi complex subunit 1 n=1 Tax=Clavelina lepadiformis TaxID=159417 RepID=A0ABP0GKZ6_CLALP